MPEIPSCSPVRRPLSGPCRQGQAIAGGLLFFYNSTCRFSHAAAAPPLGIPCGIPRCSVRFPPVFLRKTTPFSGHLPSGRPKTAGKISPGVPSVHLSFSPHGRLRRRVQPYGFTRFAFHHFQQNRSRFFSELRGVFQDFHGTARNPSPAPPPTHCMICWVFTSRAILSASLQRSPFSLPGLSTTVSWIFVGFFQVQRRCPAFFLLWMRPISPAILWQKVSISNTVSRTCLCQTDISFSVPSCFCCHVIPYLRKPPVFSLTE